MAGRPKSTQIQFGELKAAQLRQSILQAAVQGQLVQQNLHEEPASVLLERIKAEKAKLIKGCKIKKEKPLPTITKEEIPYDVPEGWVWCRFIDVATIASNLVNPKEFGEILHLAPDNIEKNTGKLLPCQTVAEDEVKSANHRCFSGQVVYSKIRPALRKATIISFDALCSADMYPLDVACNTSYFLIYLLSDPFTHQVLANETRVKMPKTNQKELSLVLVPLPPLDEQQRIVAKVDELMALCDELEAAEKELDALEANFADYLPKSILQAAVQGKLVPQNLHDEPASALLERIKGEKAKLTKEGKIKKEKALPPITEEEIPYDLPEGWAWCRLGEVIEQNIGGGTPSKGNSSYWNGDIPWASVKDLSSKTLSSTQDRITLLGLNSSSSNLIPPGNIIVCTRMGLGKIAVNTIPVAINQDLRALSISNNIDKEYFINFYSSLSIAGSGMTVKGISIDELHCMLLPLPPLAEQQRIAAKVDELMAVCDELKNIDATALLLPTIPEGLSLAKTVMATMPPPAMEERYGIAARGEVSEKLSDKHRSDRHSIFEDDA